MGIVLASLLAALAVGVGLGWWLRPRLVWCPRCGWSLTCRHCGHRPTLATRR